MVRLILIFVCCLVGGAQEAPKWQVHDMARPQPRQVIPGTESSQQTPGRPPSDAIVLFDGTNLSHWMSITKKGVVSEPKWKVENGYVEVVRGAGSLVTKEKFGSIQIHVEWATPSDVHGSGQDRGNSGVFLMNRYEVQILDSWNNPTYPDGQAAAIYGQCPPLVNASRRPGEWQTYDIFFEAPVVSSGKIIEPPYVTVVQNGVLVQHHVAIRNAVPETEGPLMLQDHPGPVRFRNVWVRALKGYDE